MVVEKKRMKMIKKYDKKGNLIHFIDFKGYEFWQKYDENNNVIYRKCFDGEEQWYEYDENNNEIYRKNSYGEEFWRIYDKDNLLIAHKKLSNDLKWWHKFDDKTNKPISITEKEYEEIKFREKEKEYLSRTKCSRFELIEI